MHYAPSIQTIRLYIIYIIEKRPYLLSFSVLVVSEVRRFQMRIVFESVTVIDVHVGKSKEGKDYGKLRILTDQYDLFDLFVPGGYCDKLKQLEPHTVAKHLPFDLVGAMNGGVRLLPAW